MNNTNPILWTLMSIILLTWSQSAISESSSESISASGIIIEVEYTPDNLCSPLGEGSLTITASGSSGTYEYSIDGGTTWASSNTFPGLLSGYYDIQVRDTNLVCTDSYGIFYIGCSEGRILQFGDAIYTCIPTLPDRVTLAVDRIQGFNDFYNSGQVFTDVSSMIQSKAFSWSTSDLGGAVFGVALDGDYNIYTANTSLYDLVSMIMTTDVIAIDGVTGIPTVIATLPGDWGAAQVEYDPTCDQLYVANLEDGRIYRYSTTGTLLSTFDPLAPDDGVSGLAPLGERVTGLAYNPIDGRLYYSIWANDRINNGTRNTVRSVSIDPVSCDFVTASDIEEIAVPFLSETEANAPDYSQPVLDIEFDETGTIMLLSESGYDSSVPLKIPHESRVLRYDGSTTAWNIENVPPMGNIDYQYQIGTVSDGTNALGGVDFGYAGIGSTGCTQDPGSFIVATGDALTGINCTTTGCLYGLQYIPIDGGNPTNSVLMDLARDIGSQQKGFYGDVDVVTGCCPCACPVILFDLVNEPICVGSPTQICVQNEVAGTAPYSYTWSTQETTPCITVTAGTPTDVFAVTVTDASNCFSVESVGVSPNCDYDMDLQKTLVSAGPFAPGDMVTFEIRVSNQGSAGSSSITVTDTPPAGLTFVSDNSTSLPEVNFLSSGVYEVTNLAPGDFEVFELTYTISLSASGDLVNIAEITADDGDDIDSDPDSDSGTDDYGDGLDDDDEDTAIVVLPTDYDLAITKDIVSAGPFLPGDMVTFRVTVTNQGQLPSQVMQFTDTPQTGLTFVSDNSATLPEVSFVSSGIYEVTNLAPGDSETLDLTYTIDLDVVGDLINLAQITTDDGSDGDSDPDGDETTDDLGDGLPDDDEAVVIIPIPSNYDLAISKAIVTQGPFFAGDMITFSVTVTNEGDLPSYTMQFTDTPPAGLTFVSDNSTALPEVNFISSNVYEVTNLFPGDTETLELTYTINAGSFGNLVNLVQITTDDGGDGDSDPDGDENTDDLGDGLPDDDEATVVIVLPSDYDIALDKVLVTAGPFEQGDTLTYSISIENQGDIPSAILEFTDIAPTGLNYLSDNSATLVDVTALSTNIYQVTNLGPGEIETVEITYIISPDIMGDLTNFALITADDGDDGDSDPDSDQDNDDLGDGAPDDDEDQVTITLPPLNNGQIGDYVWVDTNGNGTQDNGQIPVAGVLVELYNDNDVLIDFQYTDENGNYLFTDLFAGDYYVSFTPPEGFEITIPNGSGNDGTDSDVDGSNGVFTTPIISLDAGESDLSLDLGVYECSHIGDLIWFDSNGNNLADSNENGINGVRVELYKKFGNDWILFDHTITGRKPGSPSTDGYYHFCVAPGEYYLNFRVTNTGGLTLVNPNVGQDEYADSDVTNAFGNYTTDSFVTTSGIDMLNIGAGFGELSMGSIGNFVWYDEDLDGVMDDTEGGMGGVTINGFNMDGEMVESTISTEDGAFSVQVPANGSYYLEVIVPDGYSITLPNNGDDDTVDSDVDNSYGPNTTAKVIVGLGQDIDNVDIGLVDEALPVEWLDIDGAFVKDINRIRWSVASENSVSHYELQRSEETREKYVTIHSQESEYSTTSDIVYYSAEDKFFSWGINYYRVKQYDLNGNHSFSDVVAINNRSSDTAKQTTVAIYPNPASSEINLDIGLYRESSDLEVNIFDQLGRVVQKSIVIDVDMAKGLKSYLMDVSSLPNAIYTLEVIIDNEVLYEKIIIND